MDYRQLQLALDFLYQRPDRNYLPAAHQSFRPGSALSQGAHRGAAPQPSPTQHRLRWNRSDRARHRMPAGGAGKGSGGWLVWILFHSDALGDLDHLDRGANNLGAPAEVAGDRTATVEELQLCCGQPDDVRAGPGALRGHRLAAPVYARAGGIY